MRYYQLKNKLFFDIIAILKEKSQIYQIQNRDHNYNPILAKAYPAHKKIMQIDKVLDQIANYIKTSIPLQ